MLSRKVRDVIPLLDRRLIVFFEDGKVKEFDTKSLDIDYPEYKALDNEALFKQVRVEPGGYGISWNEELDCSEGELYDNGSDINLRPEDFLSFAQNNLISTKEAAAILNCSKQNIDDLVKRDKLHPIKVDGRYNLFLKAEVNMRTW